MLPNDPQDPNNPSADSPNTPNSPDHPSVHSEVAKHRKRDAHGRFIPSERLAPPSPQQPPPNPQTTPSPSNLPSPITITENTKYSEKKDPPLFNISVMFTNPVTYFKKWVGKFLKNQDIDMRLRIKPFATIGLVLAFSVVGGTAFSIGRYLFPNSSPIFHRQVVYQGVVQKSDTGQYLLASSDNTLWKLKSKNNNINIANLEGKQVVVTGNLTSEVYLIEVSEVIVSETYTQSLAPSPIPTPQISNTSTLQDQDLLPKLYANITWETNQKKILTFTSGKRRIEQEGVYLESAQVNILPQDFLNYYTNQLTNLGFKQTLNSTDPDGTMITYSKDELFLTFGIKNIYSGSGDNKKIVGYRAYIEHN